MSLQHDVEIKAGNRFKFGENWSRFLAVVDENRIKQAERSLCEMLMVNTLEGKKFLDIGCGSGLFSLAARRLGAVVFSFDYDPKSVACANELKQRYFSEDPNWQVEQGSVLDREYLETLGQWDIVYSWGVLHHTGEMWQALDNVEPLISDGGKLFISIYNDQGGSSRRWRFLKRTYNRLPILLRPLYTALVMGPRDLVFLIMASLKGKPSVYFSNIINYSNTSVRGMSYWHDMVDWIGGYPFEVAKPEEIFDFFTDKNMTLCKLKTVAGSIACNEYVFQKA